MRVLFVPPQEAKTGAVGNLAMLNMLSVLARELPHHGITVVGGDLQPKEGSEEDFARRIDAAIALLPGVDLVIGFSDWVLKPLAKVAEGPVVRLQSPGEIDDAPLGQSHTWKLTTQIPLGFQWPETGARQPKPTITHDGSHPTEELSSIAKDAGWSLMGLDLQSALPERHADGIKELTNPFDGSFAHWVDTERQGAVPYGGLFALSQGVPALCAPGAVPAEYIQPGGFIEATNWEETRKAIAAVSDEERKAWVRQKFDPQAMVAAFVAEAKALHKSTAREDHRPWGYYVVLCDEADHKVKRIVVSPGKRLSLQRHKHREEQWNIVAGKAVVTLNGEKITRTKGQSIQIPRGAIHRIECASEENLVFIETQTGDYFGEDDIERLQDDFGRA